jgi:electron-transferring-flavoprotein dehydrogenase
MAAEIKQEKLLYLLDPIGASRRPKSLKLVDKLIRGMKFIPGFEKDALSLPFIPPFLQKEGGLVLSIGQFSQWIGANLMGTGTVAIWPGTPVDSPIVKDDTVVGVRLMNQGTDKQGQPSAGFMPGMDIKSALTVVADGPYGPIGRQLDESFGVPENHHQSDWALGIKMVIDLRADLEMEPGTVYHTFGFPEPEIFGFLYVHSPKTVSAGVFIPSWYDNPIRSSYRYLQHWMMHPYFWRYLEGGKLRSWGAKSIQESGRRAEPHLAGNGYARIGEGSGSTNILTGSGFDEAWTTGHQLAEAVIDLLEKKESFTQENLERTYVRRRRESWLEKDAKIAERSRDGFQKSFIRGMMGMALSGFSGGKLAMGGTPQPTHQRIPSIEEYFKGVIPPEEIALIRKNCEKRGAPLHDALMERAGWPEVPLDGVLMVSHQDALLMGGKVQAPPGYADHVIFRKPELCQKCSNKICVEMCSGQAIEGDVEDGVRFDREKCVHCGACVWNCSQSLPENPEMNNVEFRAGTGGFHSAEN